MKKIVYLVALVAISLLFVQCGQNSSSQGQGKHPGHEYVDSSTPLEPIFVDLDSSTPLDTPILELGNKHKGHEYVDLGLPSGLKWATCNVGATTPEEYGDYFAWGEVEPKDYYDWSTYKYCTGFYATMTKYCNNRDYGKDGFTDYKTVLDPKDDAATVNWGGAWRMPTKEEQDELRNNCTWTWTTQNGVNGYKVTGPNGNSIFLPATGCMYEGTLRYAGSNGNYRSSSLCTGKPSNAYYVYFFSGYVDWRSSDRYYGFTVRPVCNGQNSSSQGQGKHPGHEYVDLGLSVKWATCNVGAENPYDYGDYFAWGEVEPKDDYIWRTYKYSTNLDPLTKYCNNRDYGKDGFTDYKTVLDPKDDAATANWGGAWRMPTTEEQQELVNNCTWIWTTQNGVNGYKVTGPNGNSIFLPAAGFMTNSSLDYAGSGGAYWSSSLYADDPSDALGVFFLSDVVDWGDHIRNCGLAVRPVCK